MKAYQVIGFCVCLVIVFGIYEWVWELAFVSRLRDWHLWVVFAIGIREWFLQLAFMSNFRN
jgi:hypothetical protein